MRKAVFFTTPGWWIDPRDQKSCDLQWLCSGSATNTDLGSLFGLSSASGINDSGQVEGWSDPATGAGAQSAFLYSNGKMIDLNSLLSAGSGWSDLYEEARLR